jgi:FG-GAP-like repeat/Abnormal spindle-like microcephaly-assoc'd, ASPM-SPD-2-Hydin
VRSIIFAIIPILLSTFVGAQSNPVPLINQPLVPSIVEPGGPGFTLSVNGSGFVSGSVVNWNGAPRPTTFVSSTKLTTNILAADIVTPSTAAVSVSTPTPGGGTSNVAFLQIAIPNPSPSFTSSSTLVGGFSNTIVAGDFNGDHNLDIAAPGIVFLGRGDGTFAEGIPFATGIGGYSLTSGDFNGDGKLDIALTNNDSTGLAAVVLGNGDGTFGPPVTYSTGAYSTGIAAADLNGDGKLDLVVANQCSNANCTGGAGTVAVLLGNGDGTFQPASNFAIGDVGVGVAIGDFNLDGKLDVAIGYNFGPIGVLLGNGDGTLQPFKNYGTQGADYIFAADLNGDGNLDFVSSSGNGLAVIFGNGDGTFGGELVYPTTSGGLTLALGDFNEDGVLDAILGAGQVCSIFFGNGDGTFQAPVTLKFGGSSLASGDFNNDGRTDFIASGPVVLQTPVVVLSPLILDFGNVDLGTTSEPQTVSITNTSAQPVQLASIVSTGDFAQTNTCPVGGTLQAGASCNVSVTFTPTAVGFRTGAVQVQDNASGSIQSVSLTGSGVAPAVSLSPLNMSFPSTVIFTTTQAQVATLKNVGSANLLISSILASGDFAQTNSCPSVLSSGNSCAINISFTPTTKGARTGSVTITDNAVPPAQIVNLTGTGTVVFLYKKQINFPPVLVGKKSPLAKLILSNVGSTPLNFVAISIQGKNPGDFSQTNTCGAHIPAGGSCSFSIIFAPTVTGARQAVLTITDNGGASPQRVTLTGTGT